MLGRDAKKGQWNAKNTRKTSKIPLSFIVTPPLYTNPAEINLNNRKRRNTLLANIRLMVTGRQSKHSAQRIWFGALSWWIIVRSPFKILRGYARLIDHSAIFLNNTRARSKEIFFSFKNVWHFLRHRMDRIEWKRPKKCLFFHSMRGVI